MQRLALMVVSGPGLSLTWAAEVHAGKSQEERMERAAESERWWRRVP